VREFVDVESGRKDDRPKLHEAIRLCQIMVALVAGIVWWLAARTQANAVLAGRDLLRRWGAAE